MLQSPREPQSPLPPVGYDRGATPAAPYPSPGLLASSSPRPSPRPPTGRSTGEGMASVLPSAPSAPQREREEEPSRALRTARFPRQRRDGPGAPSEQEPQALPPTAPTPPPPTGPSTTGADRGADGAPELRPGGNKALGPDPCSSAALPPARPTGGTGAACTRSPAAGDGAPPAPSAHRQTLRRGPSRCD